MTLLQICPKKSWPCRKFVRKIHDPVQKSSLFEKCPTQPPLVHSRHERILLLPVKGIDFFFSDLKMWNVLIGVVVWSLTYLLLLKSKRFNNKETVSRVLAVLHSFLASRCVEIFVLDFPFHFRKFGQVSGLYASMIENNFIRVVIFTKWRSCKIHDLSSFVFWFCYSVT